MVNTINSVTLAENYYKQIHALIRRFQKQNRFVAAAHDTNLSPAESHLMIEIDARPGIIAKELSELLLLDKATISRLLAGLAKKGLIAFDLHENDKKRKHLRLNRKGSLLLDDFDREANAHLSRFAENLSKAELNRLHAYFLSLAETLKAPKSPHRPNEHFFRPLFRSLTRSFGLLESGVMDSTLTPLQWHILSEIDGKTGKSHAWELCKSLHTAKNTVSVAIKTLQAKELLVCSTSSKDKRARILRISKKGKETLLKIEAANVRDLKRAFPASKTKPLADFVDLFERFVGVYPESLFRQPSFYRILTLCSEEQRSKARHFLLEQYSRKRATPSLPELFFGADSLCHALTKKEDYIGVCEFQKRKSGYVLCNCAFKAGEAPLRLLAAFLLRCARELLTDVSAEEISLELPEDLLRSLKEHSSIFSAGQLTRESVEASLL